MRISLILAMDEAGLIGKEGGLPWHLPNDLRHFKRLTVGKPVIMGRRTREEIGTPLRDRTNIVLSRSLEQVPEGFLLARDLDESLTLAGDVPEVMIIGGAQIYAAFLPRADRIHLTLIHHRFAGDTRVPPFDPDTWVETLREDHEADERNPHAYSFALLERRRDRSRASGG
jgi:dihydrofolate reductase